MRMTYSCFRGETTPDTSNQPAGGAEGLSHLSGVFILRLPTCFSGITPVIDDLSV